MSLLGMTFSPLITLHVALGELVAISSLWAVVEIIEKPSATRVKRAGYAMALLVAAAWLSYLVGGYYYVSDYGLVKPVIKEGPWDWAHKVFMEVKEHLFLPGPYVAIAVASILYGFKEELVERGEVRMSVIASLVLLFIGVALILGMGVVVSAGYRVALAGG